MPRRRGASGRPSGKRRRPQNQRRESSPEPGIRYAGGRMTIPAPYVRPDRPALLPLVPTTGTCPTGKMRYGSSVDASEALRRARINRKAMGSQTVEDHWYPQPGDKPCVCGGFHLTSKERHPPKPKGSV